MRYAPAIVAFALVGISSSAWLPNNSTAILVGSASGVSPPNPPTTGTSSDHPPIIIPSGHGPDPSHGISTGFYPSISGSSGSGHPSGSGYNDQPHATLIPTTKTVSVGAPGITSTITQTHYITTTKATYITKFVPCSTAVATKDGHTYYSSSLTTSVVPTTLTSVIIEYTVLCPTSVPKHGSNSGSGSGTGSDSDPYPGSVDGASKPIHNSPSSPNRPDSPSIPNSPDNPTESEPGHQGPYHPPPSVPPFPRPSNSESHHYPSGSGTGKPKPTGTGAHGTGKGAAHPTGTGAQPIGTGVYTMRQ